MDPEWVEKMRELDAAGLGALIDACNDYHSKHGGRVGAARMCVCGKGNGGSKACRGLSVLKDLFRYADFENPQWVERFEFVRSIIG